MTSGFFHCDLELARDRSLICRTKQVALRVDIRAGFGKRDWIPGRAHGWLEAPIKVRRLVWVPPTCPKL